MMGESIPSSPAVKSQISICDGDHIQVEEDSRGQSHTPLSQAQFQTQIPLSGGVPNTVSLSSPQPNPIQHSHSDLFVPRAYLSVNEQLSAAFVGKAPGHTSAKRIEQPVKDVRRLHDASHELSDHPSSSYDQEIEHEELPQVAIVVATAREALAATRLIEQQRSDLKQKSHHGERTAMPTMPAAMFELMRNFRSESQNGRYLPRRVQAIPKAQEELLRIDESWQPPLVGKLQRPGTVPLDLLNKLTEEADEQNNVLASTAVAEPNAPDETHTDSPRLLEQSGNSTEESELEDVWSLSSVESPRIPPDSSPTKPVLQHSHGSNRASPIKPVERGAMASSQRKASAGSVRRDAGTKNPQASPTATIQHEPITSSLSVSEPSVSSFSQARDLPGRQNNHTAFSEKKDASLNVSHKSVEVYRTPYNLKPQTNSRPFSASTASVVHGTFDDNGVTSVNQDSGTTPFNQDKSTPADNIDSFEIDSSEDQDMSHTDISEKDSYTLPSVQRHRTRFPSSTSFVNSGPHIQTISPKQNGLKRNALKNEKLAQRSQKRRCTLPVGSRQSEHEDKPFSVVDDFRRQHRREFFQSLKKHRSKTHKAILSVTNGAVEASSVPATSSVGYASSPKLSPNNQKHTKLTDSIVSTHESTRKRHEADRSIMANSSLSDDKDSLTELYLKFKVTYGEYGGDQKHFIAACQLLKDLHTKGRATHPSLWDDFVFRHHHDYRDHLMSVMENCGSALSYEDFYETRVEVPTQLKRVIRPAHIDNWSVFSSMKQSTSTVNGDAGNRSINQGQNQTTMIHLDETSRLTTSVARENDSREIARSQTSSQSVRTWLERAAGAESPELGTPRIDNQGEGDVSPINLRAATSPTPIVEGDDYLASRQAPTLPSTISIGLAKSGTDLVEQSRGSKPMALSTLVNTSGSASVGRHHKSDIVQTVTTQRKSSTTTPSARMSIGKPFLHSHERSRPALPQSPAQTSTPKPDALSHTRPNKGTGPPPRRSEVKVNVSSKPDLKHAIDTPFKHFVRQYSELASEKRMKLDQEDANRFIEIFSWRE